jgi:hypothetical protein
MIYVWWYMNLSQHHAKEIWNQLRYMEASGL